MSNALPHIAVCICTYKRLSYLGHLLSELARQETENRFTFSIVVADNDHLESARPLVQTFAAGSSISTIYCVEPRQNISLTRNRALQHADGDFVAFIDDDEYPIARWLLALFLACEKSKVDGVLGPVKPAYETQPPAWVVQGKFYDRPSYPTGFVIDWRKGRTGNVLLKKSLFAEAAEPFRPELLTGEDQDFFRRMIEKGHVFSWCEEAIAYEVVPASRWKISFLLRRALLRGKISLKHPTSRFFELLKSAIAVPSYLLALPFMLMMGKGIFMKYLIKTFDHAGKLLAAAGVNFVSETYVTE